MADETIKGDVVSRFKGLDSILPLGGALLIIIGSFLAWASVSVLFMNVSASGMDGDGKYTAIAGAAIVILAILRKTVWNKNAKTDKFLPWAFLVLGAIALAIVIYDAAQFVGLSSSYAKINIGIGMYIIAIGSLAAMANTLKPLLKLKKNVVYIVLAVLVVIFVGVGVLGHRAKQNRGWDLNPSSTADDSGSSLFGSLSNLNSESTLGEDTNSSSSTKPTVTVVSKTVRQSLSYSSDSSYVMGEIKNTSNTDAYIQEVTASLYLNGTVVASGTSSYTPTMLKKGATAPFKTMITSVPKYDDVKVTVSTKSSAQVYQKCTYFDVLNSTPRDGGYGTLLVAGEVKNSTSRNYGYGNIYVWLVDASDKVLDVTNAYINSTDAGSKNTFEASIYFDNEIPAYKDIKVIAESCY